MYAHPLLGRSVISAARDLCAHAHTYYLGICMYEGDLAAVNMMEEVMLPFMVSTSSHFCRCVPQQNMCIVLCWAIWYVNVVLSLSICSH